MAKQNFIAKALCKLGGDKYTREGTENSLRKVLHEAQENTIPFDIQRDKWILLSDLHKGGKNGADDFLRCEKNYVTALKHYFEQGYSLCVMGDAEELWEEFPETVIRENSASFSAEKRFHDEGRYLRLWGNHDEIWGDPHLVQKILQPLYGARHLHIPEAILLNVKDGTDPLGRILLIHGHQGTQNEGTNTRFAKWLLHNIWRPIQIRTGFSCNTPATDWKLRRDRDKAIYHWTMNQPGLVLIAGHTHAPVFESYSHRARLVAEISEARASLDSLPSGTRMAHQHRIEKLSTDLQNLESKLSTEERQQAQSLENPLPCYFNTGCCSFADGDITGIEINGDEICLVRWPEDNGNPGHKVLQTGSLKVIFAALRP